MFRIALCSTLLLAFASINAQAPLNAQFNDSLPFLKLDNKSLHLFGDPDANNVFLGIKNQKTNGSDFRIISTGGSSPFGPGKLLFTEVSGLNAEIALAIDSSGSLCNCVNPDPSALLELRGTTGGLLLPRMNSTQRNNIPDPSEGLVVFDKTLDHFVGRTLDTLWRVMDPWLHTGASVFNDTIMFQKVGINTSEPATELDVNGQITSSALAGPGEHLLYADEFGRIKYWNDTMLNFQPFSALEFIPNGGTMEKTFESNQIGVKLEEGAGSLFLPLNIPIGVWNDTMMVAFTDNSSSNLTIEVIGYPHDGSSTAETFMSYTSSGSASGIRITKQAILTTNENLTEYAFYLKISSGNWQTGQLAVHSGYLQSTPVFE